MEFNKQADRQFISSEYRNSEAKNCLHMVGCG